MGKLVRRDLNKAILRKYYPMKTIEEVASELIDASFRFGRSN